MAQFKLTDLAHIVSQTADRSWLSGRIGDMIHSSLELEVKVFDGNPRTGVYVVVLEGRLEPTEGPHAGDGAQVSMNALATR